MNLLSCNIDRFWSIQPILQIYIPVGNDETHTDAVYVLIILRTLRLDCTVLLLLTASAYYSSSRLLLCSLHPPTTPPLVSFEGMVRLISDKSFDRSSVPMF